MTRSTVPAVRRLVVLLAFAVLAVAAGEARASSIVYINPNDGNLWLTTPDGARQRQVTTDGTLQSRYTSPSMADDGTIVALKNKHFVRMRPDGTRIGDPVPGMGSTVETSGNLFMPTGPLDPMVSPDGRLIAYWFGSWVHHCRQWWDCSYELEDHITWSHADRFTSWQETGLVDVYREPSWIDDGRLVAFNYGLGVKTVATIDAPAAGAGLHQWFSDESGAGRQLSKGQITRDGRRMALLVGTNGASSPQEELYLIDLPEGPGGPVRPVCRFYGAAEPSKNFGWPSWSPDGSSLSWMESDGVHVSQIPDISAETVDCGSITERHVVFGGQPFWGAADVPEDPPQRAQLSRRRAGKAVARRARPVTRRERRMLAAAGLRVQRPLS